MTRAVVVDDDPLSGRLAQRVLHDLGVDDVLLSADGAGYEAHAAETRVDLLLLDIRLGNGESGLSLAARALGADGPAVVMVSAVDDPAVFSEAVALGAHGYVVKPYRASELHISALNALRRRDLERQAARHQDELVAVVDRRTAELRATVSELERLSRVREEMLANCSHELKTPLTPILGWAAYLLKRPDASADQVRSCAAVIAEQGKRLLDVVDGLLAASAISTGAPAAVAPAPSCDAAAVVRSVLAERAGAEPTADVPTGPVPVALGEQSLRVVLHQLLANCERFAPGSPVGVRVRPADTHVELCVQDRGPGLPPDRSVEELIESFVQGDGSSTRAVGGLGIGLYVVSGLVTGHGGTFELQRRSGGGLSARVTLPAAEPVADPAGGG